MLPKINLPATASLWYSLANIISRGATFIFTPIFTRALSPQEYGIYSLYTSYMGIFTVITTLEISGNAAYLGLNKFEGEKGDTFLSCALGFQIFLSASAFALYIIFSGLINSATSLSTTLTVLLLIQIFINSTEGLYFAKKRYSYNYKPVTLINTVSGILSPILALVMIRVGAGGVARIIAPLTVSALFTLPIILELLKKGRRLYSPQVWKFLVSVCLPMLPYYLSLSVIAQNDKIIIAKMLGSAAVGKYSVAYSMGYMLSLMTGGLALGFSPWIIRKLKSYETKKIRNSVSASMSAICAMTLVFLTAVPEIFGILAPMEYKDSLSVIYPVSASVIFSFLSSLFTSVILHFNKPRLLLSNSLFSAILSIALSLVLIGNFGYIGGACSTFISYFLIFSLNLSSSKKLLGENIIGMRTLTKNIILLVLFVPLLYCLREVLFSRIILLIAFIFIFAPDIKACKNLLL